MLASVTNSRIGFLGPEKLTNGYRAAVQFAARLFHTRAPDQGWKGCDAQSHTDVIQNLSNGEIDYAVIAIENTHDGLIADSVRGIARAFEAASDENSRIRVIWEESLPIEHQLFSRTGNWRDVRQIKSHESALRQCQGFVSWALREPAGIKKVVSSSTGTAAQEAAKDLRGEIAALAAPEVEKELNDISKNLALVRISPESLRRTAGWNPGHSEDRFTDFPLGFTRFWVLAKNGTGPPAQWDRDLVRQPTGDRKLNRTCMLVNLPNRKNAMGEMWQCLEGHFISTIFPYPRIPTMENNQPKHLFDYNFFVEIEGHEEETAVRKTVKKINTLFSEGGTDLPACICLGSYPNTSWFELKRLTGGPELREQFRRSCYPSDFYWRADPV